MSDATRIVRELNSAKTKSADDLLPLVYEELRKLAAARLSRESPGQTLQATALVHEAWLRLGGGSAVQWENSAHFFGAAAEAMRRILIENARKKSAARRGANPERVNLDFENLGVADTASDDHLIAVNEALEKFARIDKQKTELVKLRYFAGLSFEQASAVLGISIPTAKRWWAYSRAWLTDQLR